MEFFFVCNALPRYGAVWHVLNGGIPVVVKELLFVLRSVNMHICKFQLGLFESWDRLFLPWKNSITWIVQFAVVPFNRFSLDSLVANIDLKSLHSSRRKLPINWAV